MSFAAPTDEGSATSLVDMLRGHARALADDAALSRLMTAHRLNVAFELPGADGTDSGLLAPYAAVTEIGFASVEDLAAGVRSPGFAEAERELLAGAGQRLSLVTAELLLYAEG